MRLLRASFQDFRNLERAELTLAPRFNVLVGPNGQGKTNTLEGIYLLSALRPLRNVQRRALIRFGAETARLEALVEKAGTGLVHELEMTLTARARVLGKDTKRCDARAFIGLVVSVAFTPDDLQLPKGGPDARRRFLDRALLNLRPAYLERALRYARALKDRNRLLASGAAEDLLRAYDEVLAREGAAMTLARAAYAEELAPRVRAQFGEIAAPAPELTLHYESRLLEPFGGGLPSEGALVDRFLEELARRREQDRRRKTTSIGPHLDDLEITLDAAPARERASQGQHRAIVLALKLAEIAHLTDHLGEPPILLLDDMSSELDPTRSAQLFEAVGQMRGQVVLTSTEPPRALAHVLGGDGGAAYWDVREGRLTPRTA